MKIEIIILAILIVLSAITGFDFIVYVLKSAPKSSYFTKRMWIFGFLSTIALVYWYLNGMKFL